MLRRRRRRREQRQEEGEGGGNPREDGGTIEEGGEEGGEPSAPGRLAKRKRRPMRQGGAAAAAAAVGHGGSAGEEDEQEEEEEEKEDGENLRSDGARPRSRLRRGCTPDSQNGSGSGSGAPASDESRAAVAAPKSTGDERTRLSTRTHESQPAEVGEAEPKLSRSGVIGWDTPAKPPRSSSSSSSSSSSPASDSSEEAGGGRACGRRSRAERGSTERDGRRHSCRVLECARRAHFGSPGWVPAHCQEHRRDWEVLLKVRKE